MPSTITKKYCSFQLMWTILLLDGFILFYFVLFLYCFLFLFRPFPVQQLEIQSVNEKVRNTKTVCTLKCWYKISLKGQKFTELGLTKGRTWPALLIPENLTCQRLTLGSYLLIFLRIFSTTKSVKEKDIKALSLIHWTTND